MLPNEQIIRNFNSVIESISDKTEGHIYVPPFNESANIGSNTHIYVNGVPIEKDFYFEIRENYNHSISVIGYFRNGITHEIEDLGDVNFYFDNIVNQFRKENNLEMAFKAIYDFYYN